ncbi:MAG: hypothetical protein ACRDDA_09130, partial [Aeromonas sp.]
MDLPESAASLQKTSPDLDPAAMHRLSTELSTQASVLAVHQQQLTHLTSVTEELVKTLQSMRMTHAESSPPVTTPRAAAVSAPNATSSPRLAFPDKYDGSPASCKGFLLQCSLFLSQQPMLYPTDESRIAFICSLLTGKALEWATTVWVNGQPSYASLDSFLQYFRQVFEHAEGGKEAGELLLALRQGKQTAAEYALTFRTQAAQTSWVEDTLKLLFRKGLNMDLQSELACRDEGRSLNEFIDLAIRIDNLIRARRPVRVQTPTSASTFPVAEPEPMQIGATHLSLEERDRRMRQRLCLYCGQPGHMRASCPTRPTSRGATAVSSPSNASNIKIAATLVYREHIVQTEAMIDSGAAGNFMDLSFAQAHNILLIPCDSVLSVAALDGRPLGTGKVRYTSDDITLQIGSLHKELLRFFLIKSPQHPLILGSPWLREHNPQISWADNQITQWSTTCLQTCIQAPSRPETKLPAEYHDLIEVCSKTRAAQLPPHRDNDCAIDLLPGATPPRGRIFP